MPLVRKLVPREASGRAARRAVVGCAAVLAACGPPDTRYFGHVEPVSEPGHLRYCNQGEPEQLDPTLATTTVAVRLVHQMFEGLVIYDLDGKPVPGLASSWEASADQRRFTFHLRPARWSSGRALDAYDVGYQVVRVLHPTTASGNASNLPTLKGATGFQARALARLTRDQGELRAGQLVEIVRAEGQELAKWKGGERPNPNLRRGARPLRLRDLGASEEAGYGTVPTGAVVEVLGTSGSNVFPPAADGQVWSYVYWGADEGRYGWVPSAQLEEQVFAKARFGVRPLAARDAPSWAAATAPTPPAAAPPEPAAVALTDVPGAALELSPEALGVRVVDRRTVVFETSYPTPYFLHLAANRALRPTPIEVVSRAPRRWATPGRIVTSGPMTLAAWRPRDLVELRRSPTYWDPGAVKLDKLTAYSLDDVAAATNYYFSGRCDAVATNQIPGSYLPALSGERRGGRRYQDYKVAPFLSTYFVLLNVEELPSRHLRRALNFAVDRRNIPSFTHGGEHPTAQVTPGAAIASLTPAERALCGLDASADPTRVAMIMVPGELCYVAPPGLDVDLAKAREELALARRELGAAFPERLVYRYNSGSEVHKFIAEYLQQQWQQVGLSVELAVQEWRSLVADTSAGKYQLARFGNAATFPNPETEYLALFACGASFNRTRYCNPEFDRRLDEIRSTTDPAERNRKVYEAEELVAQDAVVIPLYVYTQRHLHKPYVRDLAINLVDQPPLYRAWLDPSWRADEAER
ncbi:MAG: peptide ABC transporter substrate-binding protein [Kofleriaceae bacterium]